MGNFGKAYPLCLQIEITLSRETYGKQVFRTTQYIIAYVIYYNQDK